MRSVASTLENVVIGAPAAFCNRRSGSFRRPLTGYSAWSRGVIAAVGLVATFCFIQAYLTDPSLPGSVTGGVGGWWDWFDQGATRRSTAALTQLDATPWKHHYPLGYAALGLPLYWLSPDHPYVLANLLCFLAVFAASVSVAGRLGLAAPVAALLFAGAVLTDGVLLRQWVIPWNTAPVGASVWIMLAVCCAWLDGRRRPFLVGLLLGAIAVCRPSDVLVAMPCLLTLVIADRRGWRERVRDLAVLAFGAALTVAPFAALHLAIFGPAPSDYMRISRGIGFTLHDFGWKAYVIGADPYVWFQDGKGLLQHAHWLALGAAGLLPALVRGAKDRMVAAVLIVHGVLYISYIDLLPLGLWRFLNIHYFAWAVPGYALLAALLIRDVFWAGWPRRVAVVSAAVTMLVLCLRVVPIPARADQPAKAVDFAGAIPPFIDTLYSGRLALHDEFGPLRDVADVRTFLHPGGVRVIGLRRDLGRALAWLPGHAPWGFDAAQQDTRWTSKVRWRWPPIWWGPASGTRIPVPTE